MQVHRARPWLASLFALLASGFMVKVAEHEHLLLLPAALPAIAAPLFHIRKLQAQMLARAGIWSAVMLGMLFAHLERQPSAAIAMVVSGALALLIAGRSAASAEPGAFRPVAYQKTLTLSLVLALADTLTLWMWTAFALLGGAPRKDTLGFFICAVITLASVIGLYRLRMWGLALGVLGNLGIAIVFGARIIDVQELRIVFITTALTQLLVALPVLVGVIRRRPMELPAWLQNSTRVLYPAALLGVIALALQPLTGRSILLDIAMWLLH
ncbi:MAG TPA: hypothetical protein VNO30_02685 [Kofleriaceae bacterium]|nr:hypothetical protein [Kofleriaceae bacterium]